MPTFLLLSGLALGAAGAALLRAAQGGDRRLMLAGWLAIAAMAAAFALAMGAETGLPAAIAVLSVLALALVAMSARWRPWRSKARPAADDIAPARRESWRRQTGRWFAAGPLAFVSAILAVAALTICLGGGDEDALILTMTAIVLAWAVLAAWAFSTRKPLRTLSIILVLAALGGAVTAANIFA